VAKIFLPIGARPALHLFRFSTTLFKSDLFNGTKECAMLVLTRKMQQQIKVGDDIVITILKVRGKQVQIGIEAPRNVRVLRGEVPAHEPASEPVVVERMPVERPRPMQMPGRRFGRLQAARACTLS